MNGVLSPTDEVIAARDRIRSVREEIAKAVIGQAVVVDHLLVGLLAGGHVLIEGVPGLGKTLMVRALARTFGGRFARVQFTPDLMPSDVTGHELFDSTTGGFTFRKGPAFTNLLLADEINRSPAKTQAALLEVMQERQVTTEGRALPLDRPFMVMATQNPFEQEGTYPLPESELDRFLMKVLVGYPDEEDEARLLRLVTEGRVGSDFVLEHVAQVLTVEDVLALQRVTAGLRVDPAVHAYAVRIARATRDRVGIAHGAGPRATISLIRAAKGRALLEGNAFVTPDDVKRMAPAVLRHRIALAADLEIEGAPVDEVIAALLEDVEAPRL
ncbi:MAG: MoxR family ATPase [Spirochaetaceae bacterium]|nr:MoxR family ATPase [Myxococcales bacterium]MCB9723282.1 MoxR family ATPase [Spirochaetaceae bacterium]